MRWLKLIVLLLFTSLLWAQPFIITKNITLEQGLVANDVRKLYIDNKGILYIGSRSGLSTVVQGKVRPHPGAVAQKFTNITTILQDKSGGMWFGSYGQGILYQRNSFSAPVVIDQGFYSDRITSLFEFNDKVYVGTIKGVHWVDTTTHEVHKVVLPNEQTQDFKVSGFFTIDKQLYVTTVDQGVFVVGEHGMIPFNAIEDIYSVYALNDKVFFGRKDGLVIYDIHSEEYQYFSNIPAVWDFCTIDGVVYFVSAGEFENNGGIYRFDGQKIEDLTAQFNISGLTLHSLNFNAKHALLYLGSVTQGVFEVDVRSALKVDTQLSEVIFIDQQQQTLFALGKEGFFSKNVDQTWKRLISSQDFKNYQVNHADKFKSITTVDNHFFPIDYTISADKIIYYKVIQEKGAYYVATNIGVFKFTATGEILSYYNIHTYEFAFFKGKFFETIPYNGVRIYSDLDAMQYTYYSNQSTAQVPEHVVDTEVLMDKLYLASALNGLFTYSEEQGFTSLYDQGVFTQNRLKFLAIKDTHSLYIATDATDVFLLEVTPQDYVIDFVVGSPKIRGSNISVITALHDKVLIGTDRGLNVFGEYESFYFDKDQGFRQVPILSSYSNDRELYLGTTEALNTISLDNFQIKHKPLAAHISSLLINGEPYDLQDLDQGQTIYLDLPSKDNSLQVSFDVLGAKFSNKLDFFYRLKGSEQWHSIKDSKIDLHYMNSGSYHVELKVHDFDSGTQFVFPLLSFKIAPLFVDTLTFKVMLVLMLVCLLSLLIVARFVRERKKNREREKHLRYEKRLAEVRLLSIRSQMNSHFIFNVLSSIQYFIVTGNQDEAFDYLGKFAKLIRTSLNFSALERVTLAQEIAYLEKYIEIENMRHEGRIHLDVDCQVDAKQVEIPPMLLQPFVENALIHAFPASIKAPLLSLKVCSQQRNILIVIQDNGIGSESVKFNKKAHPSKGVTLVRERMSLIQEYFEDDLKIEMNAHGTKVSLLLRNKNELENE